MFLRRYRSHSQSNSIQGAFERIVAKHPNAPAVYATDGECWSYSRLNTFANRIAHRLLDHGIQKEDRVGVCMGRSPETVGVLIGILKAKAAYVPLDLNLPNERLEYVVSDAAIRNIVVDDAGHSKCQSAGVRNTDLLVAAQDGPWPDYSPALESDRNDLANVLYTSGSTGRPKGVMLEHAGVLRLVVDTKWFRFSARDICLQSSSLSFDASNFEVWGPLLNGGALVTAPQHVSLADIGELIKQFNITTLWLTAGLFNVLMDEQPDAVKTVKQLLTGGDIASPRHARQALLHLKQGQLFNCYGPTENTTFSTFHRVRLSDTEQASIPIGIPVDQSSVYILDETLRPIQDGRIGEIFVGGEGLARGYWNRPELTAEKFLRVETRPGAVERLYRTGDLGRYNKSGVLEFVGRADFQVKVRGYRIEPEEVELALSSMPGLGAAAVIARGKTADTKQLCCYYIQRPQMELSPRAIKAFLRSKIPDYMIPTGFFEVMALPLNTNGKVDRNALAMLPAHAETGSGE